MKVSKATVQIDSKRVIKGECFPYSFTHFVICCCTQEPMMASKKQSSQSQEHFILPCGKHECQKKIYVGR